MKTKPLLITDSIIICDLFEHDYSLLNTDMVHERNFSRPSSSTVKAYQKSGLLSLSYDLSQTSSKKLDCSFKAHNKSAEGTNYGEKIMAINVDWSEITSRLQVDIHCQEQTRASRKSKKRQKRSAKSGLISPLYISFSVFKNDLKEGGVCKICDLSFKYEPGGAEKYIPEIKVPNCNSPRIINLLKSHILNEKGDWHPDFVLYVLSHPELFDLGRFVPSKCEDIPDSITDPDEYMEMESRREDVYQAEEPFLKAYRAWEDLKSLQQQIKEYKPTKNLNYSQMLEFERCVYTLCSEGSTFYVIDFIKPSAKHSTAYRALAYWTDNINPHSSCKLQIKNKQNELLELAYSFINTSQSAKEFKKSIKEQLKKFYRTYFHNLIINRENNEERDEEKNKEMDKEIEKYIEQIKIFMIEKKNWVTPPWRNVSGWLDASFVTLKTIEEQVIQQRYMHESLQKLKDYMQDHSRIYLSGGVIRIEIDWPRSSVIQDKKKVRQLRDSGLGWLFVGRGIVPKRSQIDT